MQIWQGSGASAQASTSKCLAYAHELLPALGLPPSTPVSLVKQARLHAHSFVQLVDPRHLAVSS